jgi:hypothetical protein
MDIDLNGDEIQTLLESLRYSKQRIADAEGTPYEVRQENIRRIDQVAMKLRGQTPEEAE